MLHQCKTCLVLLSCYRSTQIKPSQLLLVYVLVCYKTSEVSVGYLILCQENLTLYLRYLLSLCELRLYVIGKISLVAEEICSTTTSKGCYTLLDCESCKCSCYYRAKGVHLLNQRCNNVEHPLECSSYNTVAPCKVGKHDFPSIL